MKITQEMRQTAFENWETTDDHGMIIYGIAKDRTAKNTSWLRTLGVQTTSTKVLGMLLKLLLLTRL